MKYLEAVFYIYLAGLAGLLLFKLLHSVPSLAFALGLVVLWIGWELAKGLD